MVVFVNENDELMNTCADLPAAKCSLLRSAAEEQLSGNVVSSEVVAELQVKCSSNSEVR